MMQFVSDTQVPGWQHVAHDIVDYDPTEDFEQYHAGQHRSVNLYLPLILLATLALLIEGWLANPAALFGIGFLGLVATALAYVLYTWGLIHVAASTAVTLALAEPLTAWVLATGIVGEPLTPLKMLGAAMVLLGLAAVAATRSHREA